MALLVLPISRLLPDQRDIGGLGALAEDGLRGAGVKVAGSAADGGMAELAQGSLSGDQ